MLKATEVAAWVGAVAGPAALLWDFYKWKTAGPRLTITVSTKMRLLHDPNHTDYLLATVRNRGTAGTTLTNMVIATYDSWWRRIRLKPTNQFVVYAPSTTQPLPFKLEVGAEWLGMGIQDEEVQQLMATGKLWCNVYHSWSKRPVQAQVL